MYTLREVETAEVFHEPISSARWQTLSFEGHVPADRLKAIAKEIIPNMDEIDSAPTFVSGLDGCAQLLFLVCISSRLRWSGHFEP